MNKFEAHILVVDDDEGIRDLVKQYLNQHLTLYHYHINIQQTWVHLTGRFSLFTNESE